MVSIHLELCIEAYIIIIVFDPLAQDVVKELLGS